MKPKRKDFILSEINKYSYVKINDLQNALGVTEMTIRRDLAELEAEGLLIRVRGGAKKLTDDTDEHSNKNLLSLQHDERKVINIDKKEIIAKKAASLIRDSEVVFISASTTNELIYKYIKAKNIKVITNCLYIFFQYHNLPDIEAILIGGKYNDFIQSFLGTMTFEGLKNISFSKAFVGTNAITNNNLYASNEEEGLLHKTILNNAREKYVVCDSTKFNSEAFFNFYNCSDLTAIITDNPNFDNILEYRDLCNIV